MMAIYEILAEGFRSIGETSFSAEFPDHRITCTKSEDEP